MRESKWHIQLQEQLAAVRDASGWCVALSGGLDSVVLLHVLASCRDQLQGPPLRALHVHHGLQAVADQWPAQCRELCDQLGVPLQVVRVRVSGQSSVEEAARLARYQAFVQHLQANEVLMLAQHQDDQAETLLLRLLRGSGVYGLQGMPNARVLGAGSLLRPLLHVPRRQLEHYAQQQGLHWVEDPSNQANDYDRNFLRNQVWPLLLQRWPGVNQVLQRTSEHMREAQALLAELAEQDLQQVRSKPEPDWLPQECLNTRALMEFSSKRQINMVRHWLRDKTLLPDSSHWAGWQDLLQARPDAQPVWRLQGGALVRHAGLLYWLSDSWLTEPEPLNIRMAAQGSYQLPDNGQLELAELNGMTPRMAYRQGGEVLDLPGRGRRDLKRLLQERRVPVFLRNRLPLLFVGQQLVAVANFTDLRTTEAKSWQLQWVPPE